MNRDFIQAMGFADRTGDHAVETGCNIRIPGDMTLSLSRCTQNPTTLEECRKGWHSDSALSEDDILELGFQNVAMATGSPSRRDGIARQHLVAMPIDPGMSVYTPDDLMDGTVPTVEVIVHGDDHYYMGGVLAELLANNGAGVTLIAPSAYKPDWTRKTLAQVAIHQRLIEDGVKIVLNRGVTAVASDDDLPFRREITQLHLETS